MVCGSINHRIYFFSIFSVFVLKVSGLWFAIDVRFQLQKHLPTGAKVGRYESYLRESGGKTQVLASNPVITKGVMDVVSPLQCIYHGVRYNATIPYFIAEHVVHDLVQISSVSRYITNICCHCTHWYQSWPRFYKATVMIWTLFHSSHYMDQNAIRYLVKFDLLRMLRMRVPETKYRLLPASRKISVSQYFFKSSRESLFCDNCWVISVFEGQRECR